MAIGDSSKLDLLWKRVGYGVTETSSGKNAIEESIASPYIILGNQVWQEGDKIPNPASEIANVVEAVSIQLIADPTVASKNSWLAVRDFPTGITTANRLGDFIPFTVAPSYEVKLYSDSAKTQRLLPGTSGFEWVFDYSAGVVWFANALPGGVTTLYLTGYRYIGKKGVGSSSGGTGSTLGSPTDGSYDDGFIQGWVPGTTSVSDAIDQLNKTLLDVYPKAPSTIPETGLTILEEYSAFNDIPLVLSSGFTDSTNATLEYKVQPGQAVSRVFKTTVNSNSFGPFGSQTTGTITLQNNGTTVGSKVLTTHDDTGIYDHLVIVNDERYPSNYSMAYKQVLMKAIDIIPQAGLNYIQFVDENGTSNPAFFVYDVSTVVPSASTINVGITNPLNLPYEYSSGIPHLVRGMALTVGVQDITNIATELCLANKHVIAETVPSVSTISFTTLGQNGIPAAPTKATNYTAALTIPIDDPDGLASYATSDVKVTLNNPNGSFSLNANKKINVMRSGTIGQSPIDEMNILIEDLGNEISGKPLACQRVRLGDVDLPISSPTLLWDSSASTATYLNEASVVGGAIVASKENYSGANILPSGPDYSSKSDIQWVTFCVWRNAVSGMNIHVDGSYSGLFVTLPGISNLPFTINGWWDASKLYSGVGTPGREQNDGCAVGLASTGRSQDLEVTFGQENSTDYQGKILIRFKLGPNDKITGLKFTGV